MPIEGHSAAATQQTSKPQTNSTQSHLHLDILLKAEVTCCIAGVVPGIVVAGRSPIASSSLIGVISR